MKKRELGRTGFQVSELSLGGVFVPAANEEATPVVRRALELGINYIDTAPGYRNSEELLGLALEEEKRPYYISTKVGGRPKPFDPQNKGQLRYSVEESLRLLKRDQIDILMVHEPDRPGEYEWWPDKTSFYGPVSEVLQELKDEKLIRFTGLGGTTTYQLSRIVETGAFDVVLTTFNYSLLWREAEHAVFPVAKKNGTAVIVGAAMQQGALTRKYNEVETGAWWLSPPRQNQFKALYEFVDELGMSLPELGLRFVISSPDISTALMGARSVQEVEANVAAVEKGPLDKDVLQRLDEVAAMVPFRPCEEPFFMPFGREYAGPGKAR